jgi:hypothetical protein
MMDRRRFLLTSLAGALVAPLAVEAQKAGPMPRVGYRCFPVLTPRPNLLSSASGKRFANSAMWKVRASRLSTDGRRGSPNGFSTLLRSWPV